MDTGDDMANLQWFGLWDGTKDNTKWAFSIFWVSKQEKDSESFSVTNFVSNLFPISPDLFHLSRLILGWGWKQKEWKNEWNVFNLSRFHLYMHDTMKQTFLKDNEDEQWKMDFIETISVPGFKFFPEMTQQRFVKTHLPFKLLPPSIMEKRAKVIYVARHPKDVVVSYYHLNKLYRTQGYQRDFKSFFEYFMKDLCELWDPRLFREIFERNIA